MAEVARKSIKEKIRILKIREIINAQHNIELIEERLLRCFGNLKMIGHGRIPRTALHWNAENTRRKGKPRERGWME